MIKIVGINPITLDVYLSDGEKLHVKDFHDTPKVGYGVESFDDFGYRCIAIGDDTECVSCGLDNIGV
jgi:hypothetical protein